MDRISVVQGLIDTLQAKTYVEIGVSWGHAFLSIRAPRKFAVDPFNRTPRHLFSRHSEWPLRWKALVGRWLKRLGREDSRFFEMTSDDFFRRVPHIFSEHKIDVAFIDGLHTYEQAYRDVENCLRFLAPGGVIVMHDCNPADAAIAVPATSVEDAASKKIPGWKGMWCGDVWKAIVDLRRRPDLKVFVLDTDFGVGVVTRGIPDKALSYSKEDVARMSYEKDLAQERTSLLNLKDPSYFHEFARGLSSAAKEPVAAAEVGV